MRNIKTVTKILLLVAIMLFLLGTVSFVGYWTSGSITSEMQSVFENYARPAMWFLDIKALSIQNRRLYGRIPYNITAEELAVVKARAAENREKNEQYFRDYEKTIDKDDLKEKSSYENILKLREEVNKRQDEILRAGESGDPAQKEEIIRRMSVDGDITKAEGEYVDALETHASLMYEFAEREQETSVAKAARSKMMILILSIVSAVIGVAFAVLISRQITKPLTGTQKSISTFAEGDLTIDFDTKGKDEVAAMSKSLQEMSNVLGGVIGRVNKAGSDISESAHDFSALAEETNASVEEFKSNVDEMGANLDSLASASEEVNASVEEVAAGAQTTAEKGTDIARKVEDAMQAGDRGIGAVRNVVNGIGKVAESSATATGAITALGDRARQIQNFVAQIGGIADQTNLLALNAAIEAARAGEAGRGFAVVAEEVRKLAEDSNVAAKNIEELAALITSEIGNIVSLSQANVSDSNDAKDLSNKTADEISNMIAYLKDIAHATQDLAAVAEEQAASSEEIAEAVQGMAGKISSTAQAGENIRTGVTEVATASERVAQGAESLSMLSTELQEQLSFFKTKDATAQKSGKNSLRAR